MPHSFQLLVPGGHSVEEEKVRKKRCQERMALSKTISIRMSAQRFY